VQRGIVFASPFVLVYAAVGWNSEATIFRPVSIVRSVIEQDDTSSQTRDIENYNLIYTLKHHPVLGSGFGHEYMEKVQGNRVDQFFAQYRFIAHNSILWLLSLAGGVGFALIWACLPTAVLIGLITFRASPADGDRLVAFSAIAAVLCFVVQAWGDMGLQSWMGTLLVASLTGAAGAIYTRQQLTGVPA
jgi:O-antigen ligase